VPTHEDYRIRQSALDAIVAHARAVQPSECCGMLVGLGRVIEESVAAANLASRDTRFLIDPKRHIETLRLTRRQGREVLGFYHSHVRTPAWPSPTDIAESAYSDAVHLIVSLASEPPEARLFRIVAGGVSELMVRVSS
jgi:proteasome lid subunit RPN8/RPN11